MVVFSWKEIAARKQAFVLSQIPEAWKLDHIPSADEEPNVSEYLDRILPDNEVHITSRSVRELVKLISSGSLSTMAVTMAFCHRAALTHQLVNCCTEIFFDKALAQAKWLDEYYAEHGKTVGPFHGIPISVKDQVNIEGLDTSIGFIGLFNKPVTKDQESAITIKLRELGAVFYVKTTTPMAMLGETNSNAYGYTYNSVNRHLSSTGSSGGEGALIGAKASCIGLGTDWGGSIRNPSAFHGIIGLRPSHGRLPYRKVTNSMAGQPIMPSVIGPMVHNVEDAEYFMKHVLETEPWLYDAKVVPIPWRPFDVINKKFSFGVMRSDGVIQPHPPVLRAIDIAVKALKKFGHDLIEWKPVEQRAMVELGKSIFNTDGMEEIKEMCSIVNEPVTQEIVDRFKGSRHLNAGETWALADERYEIQQKFFKQWNDTANYTTSRKPIDAWIAPVAESVSHPPLSRKHYGGYRIIANLMDITAITVPITLVDKKVDLAKDAFVALSDQDNAVQKMYDPEIFDGMPVCIQLFTRRLEEEKAMALARIVRDALANL